MRLIQLLLPVLVLALPVTAGAQPNNNNDIRNLEIGRAHV